MIVKSIWDNCPIWTFFMQYFGHLMTQMSIGDVLF